MPPTNIETDQNLRPENNGGLSVQRGIQGSAQYGPSSGNLWGNRPALAGPAGGMPQQGFDIWGPLLRRKYLIALFCLIGAGLGYLYFIKTPKTYSSALKLMIITQAPPSIVNGDLKIEGSSLLTHASLIASELVLSQAVEAGELEKLATFAEIAYPVDSLKEMLRVVSDEKKSETMKISCAGPNPDDLPIILNQIVGAYRQNLEEDSKTFGEETAELIQQLSNQLSSEKRKAEERSVELYAQLGVTTVAENGQVLNPHSQKLANLLTQQEEAKANLRRLNDRFELLKQSVQSEDEDQIKVVAIEAKKYLELTRTQYDEELKQIVSALPGLRSRDQLDVLKVKHEDMITQLDFELQDLLQTLGGGHTKVMSMRKRIEHYQQELAGVEQELSAYEAEEQKRRQVGKSVLPDGSEMDLETFRAQEDRHWIKMYGLALGREIQQLQLNLAALSDEIATVSKKAEEIASGVMELNLLKRQIDEKGAAVRTILDQLNEMNITTKNYTMTKVKVLDQAGRGIVIAPSLLKSLAIGTMLAFLVGFGLAVLVDQSELSFRSPLEIAERLHIPVVGRVPRIDVRKFTATGKGAPTLVVSHSPGSTVAEAFRDIRTSLFFQSAADDVKTILFTSPSPGDGKSTTVCNLAMSIAQAGKRVILVDADFRRPRVHQYFDEEMKPGLLNVLTGEVNLVDAIRKSSLEPHLFLLTAGGRPKNPGELVTAREFGRLIAALRAKFDYVLIDSPPVLPVSDPASIASKVDGVYLVTRIRKGVKITAERAKETLDRVGARWMGIIVNGFDENPHYSEYGYQYSGQYSYYGGRYGRYYESNYKEYRDRIEESGEV